jgi:hypothetical protein
MFVPIADHRHTIANIDVQFDPHEIRTWLSCAPNDRKMLLLENGSRDGSGDAPADTAAIESVAARVIEIRSVLVPAVEAVHGAASPAR